MSVLFHISDLHFGAEDSAALAWFAGLVQTEAPDAVIVTGDITQRAKKREFAAAAEWLEALPVPVTVEPGNHDLPYFNLLERFTRPYARLRAVQDMVNVPLDLKDCTVVPLKTTARFQLRLNWSLGHVAAGAIRETRAGLSAAQADHVKLVACHHPLVDLAETGTKGRTRNGPHALRVIASAGADAVLSGHVHTPFDLNRRVQGENVRLIGAGTLSERIREHEPSFNEIIIEQGKINVTARVA
jgi:3',5'-cyclic AMP phosphodiesterase CpdA|tara:strand:+ start:9953 stop:10681 length:729 start_codon:yes stop_codon:yes gene_type:complete